MRWALALAGALALAACGGKNEWGTSQNGGENGGGQNAAPCAKGVTLRVLGTNPGAVTSLNLFLSTVGAAYEGGAGVAITGVPGALDVGESAHDLGVLHLTNLTGELGHATVTVSLSGGSAFLGETGGYLDLCTAPLSFPIDPGLVKHDTCEVVLRLDVGRSVGTTAGGLWFMPQFRVVYH